MAVRTSPGPRLVWPGPWKNSDSGIIRRPWEPSISSLASRANSAVAVSAQEASGPAGGMGAGMSSSAASALGLPVSPVVSLVGVESPIAEQEVLVAVPARAGRPVDPRALVEFLIPKLPYFMVPRYVRVVTEIPKTETNKVRKLIFREQGITADTWDRESAGIHLHREKL